MFDSLKQIAKALLAISKILRLKCPGCVFLVLTRQENEMLYFKLVLPAPSAPDVVSRELTVQIESGEPTTVILPPTSMESDEMGGNDNNSVTGQLVDVDDSGNRSDARPFEFILSDTLAPPQPGELGLIVTREE